jgi:hypothetical protein
MGLVIRVWCRCFVEGKTHPPFSGPVKVGEDGDVYLDLPWEGNEEKHTLFNRWRESGCEHERMSYASDVIQWSAYRSFQQALEAAGWEHFPTLRAEMPINGQRITAANAAPQMLDELFSSPPRRISGRPRSYWIATLMKNCRSTLRPGAGNSTSGEAAKI